MPETAPEKSPIRRCWLSAAGGTRNWTMTFEPREECVGYCDNVAYCQEFLAIVQESGVHATAQ